MPRILLTIVSLLLMVPICLSAPPDPPDTGALPDTVEPLPEEIEAPDLVEPEMTEIPDEPPIEDEDRKFIEIRIDEKGIRGIDEFGNEVVLEEERGRDDRPVERPRDDRDERSREREREDKVEFGNVYIGYDDEIYGDVVSIQGNVEVDGIVDGNIFCTKTVTLSAEAVVTGDIVAKRLVMDDAAEFSGRHKKFDIGSFPFPYKTGVGLPGFGAWLLVTIFVVLLTLILLIIMQRPAKRIRIQLQSGFLKNMFVGLLLILAIPIVMLLLCITIVGIPVAVIIYPIALFGALVLGYIGTAYWIGTAMGRASQSMRFESSFASAALGTIALMCSWLISGFFVFVGVNGLAIFFFVLGIVIVSFAAMAGLGAVWFSRFGTRPKEIDPPVSEAPTQAEPSTSTT
jgi:hypothetical protein